VKVLSHILSTNDCDALKHVEPYLWCIKRASCTSN